MHVFLHIQQCRVRSHQWIVDIEIHSFENLHGAEIRDGMFCCCDESNSCFDQLSHLPTCFQSCDTMLTIALTNCNECPGPCCIVLENANYSEKNYFSLESNLKLMEMVSLCVGACTCVRVAIIDCLCFCFVYSLFFSNLNTGSFFSGNNSQGQGQSITR